MSSSKLNFGTSSLVPSASKTCFLTSSSSATNFPNIAISFTWQWRSLTISITTNSCGWPRELPFVETEPPRSTFLGLVLWPSMGLDVILTFPPIKRSNAIWLTWICLMTFRAWRCSSCQFTFKWTTFNYFDCLNVDIFWWNWISRICSRLNSF